MVEEFDAGPVYTKEDLCLEGSAENIYIRISKLSARMIANIIENRLEPHPQVGEPTYFKRRTPAEGKIPVLSSIGMPNRMKFKPYAAKAAMQPNYLELKRDIIMTFRIIDSIPSAC